MEFSFSFLKHFEGKASKMLVSFSLKSSSKLVFPRLMTFQSSGVSVVVRVSSVPLALGIDMAVR